MPKPKFTLLQILKVIGILNLLIGFTGLFLRFAIGFSVDFPSIFLSFSAGAVCLLLVRVKTA